MWDLWLHGIPAQCISPFRCFRPDDLSAKKEKISLSRESICMKYIIAIAILQRLAPSKQAIQNMAMVETDDLFRAVFPIILVKFYGALDSSNCRRLNELAVGTLYNQLCRDKKIPRLQILRNLMRILSKF
jgi:hypothetical protein